MFFELATTSKNLGAKWLSEKKKLISCPALGVKGPVKLINQIKSVYFFATEE